MSNGFGPIGEPITVESGHLVGVGEVWTSSGNWTELAIENVRATLTEAETRELIYNLLRSIGAPDVGTREHIEQMAKARDPKVPF